MRNKVKLIGCAILPAFLVCGCAGMNNAESGTVGGGLFGAGLGAIIGHACHATGAGALIGAGTGALIGNAAGRAQDRADAKAEAVARQTALSLEDVAYMTQNHTSDTLIINQIRASGAVYHLSAEQITWLKQQGVSDVVVSEMQSTAYRYPQRVYVADPSPTVGVGFSYGRRW